jgi:hypothetical protein
MKSLNPRGFVLAFIPSLILVCAPQAAAQANTTPEPVKVVNTTKNPVPTVAQGTTKISGNVNVTNSSLPVTGSVSITNNSVPVNVTNSPLGVSGTVSVSNLPLDADGNVRTSVYPAATTYSYTYVLAYPCNTTPADLCVYGLYNPTGCPPSATVLASTVLDSLASQGFSVIAVTPLSSECGPVPGLTYTLQGPSGTRKKRLIQPSKLEQSDGDTKTVAVGEVPR